MADAITCNPYKLSENVTSLYTGYWVSVPSGQTVTLDTEAELIFAWVSPNATTYDGTIYECWPMMPGSVVAIKSAPSNASLYKFTFTNSTQLSCATSVYATCFVVSST